MPTCETKQERTFWRDWKLSLRHRLWGIEIKATDIDFTVVEYSEDYNFVRPVAIIEYKSENVPAAEVDAKNLSGQLSALNKISTRADLPFFIVVYTKDLNHYHVKAVNMWAKLHLGNIDERHMTEEEYVTFLYVLRKPNAIVPQSVIEKIRNTPLPSKETLSYYIKGAD